MVNRSYERLCRLARVLLHQDFPRLEHLQETGDVLHVALLRLLERLDDKTVYLNSGPMFHIGSLRRTLAVLHAGGRNVLCRRVEATVLC